MQGKQFHILELALHTADDEFLDRTDALTRHPVAYSGILKDDHFITVSQVHSRG
jgi:hypothetical protein